MRVLLTGAAGLIGRSLRRPLRERVSHLRVADSKPVEAEHPREESLVFDITSLDAVLEASRDLDAIVHLAGIASEAAFDRIAEANLRGAYNVFEAARREGVRRVVFASSNHVTGFYGRDERISPRDPVRPDTLYGVSKVFGEAVGSLYAHKFGLEVVALRIGAFADEPPDGPNRPMALSPGDMFRLTWAALTARDIRFEIVYGVSDTGSRWWDNAEAARRIGYEPHDRIHAREPGPGFQGDPFTNPDYHGKAAE